MQAKKEQIMQQVQGELQLANAQELINVSPLSRSIPFTFNLLTTTKS
jgi:hypothetical protein